MNIYAITSLIGSTSALALGIFVYFKDRENQVNKAFGLLSLAIFMWVFSCFRESSLSPDAKEAALLWDIYLYTGAAFAPVLFLRFNLIAVGKKAKFSVIIAYVFAAIFFILNLVPNLRLFYIKDVIRRYPFRFIAVPGPLWYLYILYYTLCTSQAFYYLNIGLKNSYGAKRNQIKYLLLSCLIIFIAATMYLFLVFNVKTPPLDNILVACYSIVTAYSIVRHQLMDIEVVIKKTVVFASLLAFVFGVFITVAYLVGQLFGGGRLLSYAITSLIIVLFHRSLETWLINATDKFLFQKKYEYKEILKAFIDEVITVLNLDEVVNSTLKLLDQTLHPYTASIFILNKAEDKYQLYNAYGLEDKNMTFAPESKLTAFLKRTHNPAAIKQINGIVGVNPEIASEMSKLKAVVVLPLMLHNDLIGFISLGRKKSDEEYTKDDLDVLLDLARTESIAVGNAQLLTEAAQAERRAAIGTMAAGIHHEIGNPLNIINTKIQLFLTSVDRGFYKGKPKEEILQECKNILNETINQSSRIADITRRLSNFAKPSKEFKPELLSIFQEIDEALFMAGHELELEKIKINKEISSESFKMRADRHDLQQVFFNIIRNAGQAIEGEGTITIRVLSTQDNKIRIEIEDTGKGISEDKQHRIFEPFFTTKGTRGTGLGLSIVRQLVWRNKGEISFRSQGGVGTTFILEFPKATE